MALKEIQEEVDKWIKQYKIQYWKPHEILARITEETGELAREINHIYGPKQKKSTEDVKELSDEIADIIFSLSCLANSLNLNLDESFKRVMDKENPLIIWGTGDQSRNYIHALDCARVMMNLVATRYNKQPINIGTEENISIKKLVLLLANIVGHDINIVSDITKPEGRYIKSADSQLLKSILDANFEWKVSLDEGLKKMINWYNLTFK